MTEQRLMLNIEIFNRSEQAMVLPGLTPAELVKAILQEFRELEYLGDQEADYGLQRVDTDLELDDERPMMQQVGPNQQLRLLERIPPLPHGSQLMGRHIYLRELSRGTVFKLHWQPAIIGRIDPYIANNDQVAVNLAGYNASLRVSRRHARIVADDNGCYVEDMSQSPTMVIDADGNETRVNNRHPLHHGDTILLSSSQIKLRVIMRD
jgi:hypothetical protein